MTICEAYSRLFGVVIAIRMFHVHCAIVCRFSCDTRALPEKTLLCIFVRKVLFHLERFLGDQPRPSSDEGRGFRYFSAESLLAAIQSVINKTKKENMLLDTTKRHNSHIKRHKIYIYTTATTTINSEAIPSECVLYRRQFVWRDRRA